MRQGRASSVTDLGGGTILRLGGRPRIEAELMELARAAGVPVPRIHEVRDDGLVLERIAGPTLAHHLARRPWTVRMALTTMVDLHERVHAVPLDGMRLVHFDLHPENILVGPAGPVLIDWTNAHAGDPAADCALTWLILETSGGLPGRLLARLFELRVGPAVIAAGLDGATRFRVADPHVTDAERVVVRRAVDRRSARA